MSLSIAARQAHSSLGLGCLRSNTIAPHFSNDRGFLPPQSQRQGWPMPHSCQSVENRCFLLEPPILLTPGPNWRGTPRRGPPPMNPSGPSSGSGPPNIAPPSAAAEQKSPNGVVDAGLKSLHHCMSQDNAFAMHLTAPQPPSLAPTGPLSSDRGSHRSNFTQDGLCQSQWR